MPFAVDQEALNSPSLKILDIHHPPMKSIPHEEFPKMVYLHPKDKTKEHLTKIVADKKELDAVVKQGWKLKAHVPEAPPDPILQTHEFEVA